MCIMSSYILYEGGNPYSYYVAIMILLPTNCWYYILPLCRTAFRVRDFATWIMIILILWRSAYLPFYHTALLLARGQHVQITGSGVKPKQSLQSTLDMRNIDIIILSRVDSKQQVRYRGTRVKLQTRDNHLLFSFLYGKLRAEAKNTLLNPKAVKVLQSFYRLSQA